MGDLKLIVEIATVGILITVLDKIFESAGRKEQGTLITLVGLIVVFMMVVGLIGKLFTNVKTMFQF
ncbi:MAG: spoIIIAC [Clostridiales bacterium]|jgi:stage III sporulation protein AC|nr:spoIIIAC [Clostridiales bacterium]